MFLFIDDPSPPPVLDLHNHQIQNQEPVFSIRDYVLSSRQKDITTNWPLPDKHLQHLLKYGIKDILPPFKPPDHLHKSSFRPVDPSTPPLVFHLDQRATSIVGTLSLVDEGEVLTKEVDQSVVIFSSDQKSVLQDFLGMSMSTSSCFSPLAESDPSLTVEESSLSDSMGSKLCPVCLTFTSNSNTDLNVHINQCFPRDSSTTTLVPYVPKVRKRRKKNFKMKLMSVIYAHALRCTLEELDIRNGSTKTVGSSLPGDELKQKRRTPIDIENIQDTEENDCGPVYFSSSGKKLQIISKLSEGSRPTLLESSNAVKHIGKPTESDETYLEGSGSRIPKKHSRGSANARSTETTPALKPSMLIKFKMTSTKHNKDSSKAMIHITKSSKAVWHSMESSSLVRHSLEGSNSVKHRREGGLLSTNWTPEISARFKHKSPRKLSVIEPADEKQLADIPRKINSVDEIRVMSQSLSDNLKARGCIHQNDSGLLRQRVCSKETKTVRKLFYGTRDELRERTQPNAGSSLVEGGSSSSKSPASSLGNRKTTKSPVITPPLKLAVTNGKLLPSPNRKKAEVLSSPSIQFHAVPSPKRKRSEVCVAPARFSDASQATSTDAVTREEERPSTFSCGSLVKPSCLHSKSNETVEHLLLNESRVNRSLDEIAKHAGGDEESPLRRTEKEPFSFQSNSVIGIPLPNQELSDTMEHTVLNESQLRRSFDEQTGDAQSQLRRIDKASTFMSNSLVEPSRPCSEPNETHEQSMIKEAMERSLEEMVEYEQPPEEGISDTSVREENVVPKRGMFEPQLCTLNRAPIDYFVYDEPSDSDFQRSTCSLDIYSIVSPCDNLPELVGDNEALVPITVEVLYENQKQLKCGGNEITTCSTNVVSEVKEGYNGGHLRNSSYEVHCAGYGADLVPTPRDSLRLTSSQFHSSQSRPWLVSDLSRSPITSAIFHPPAARCDVHRETSSFHPIFQRYTGYFNEGAYLLPFPIHRNPQFSGQQSMGSYPHSPNSVIMNPLVESPRCPVSANQATTNCGSPTVIRLMGKNLMVADDKNNLSTQLSSTATGSDSPDLDFRLSYPTFSQDHYLQKSQVSPDGFRGFFREK